MRLLGISGSLRAASTNSALLRAAAASAPDGTTLSLYGGLGALPIFDPDLDQRPDMPAVMDLRRQVQDAGGLVIACPEYAHGIPGGLKNALDWLVSGSEIPGKPVALFHASARSMHGRHALAEVLRTMSAVIVSTFTLPLLGLDPDSVARRLSDPVSGASLRAALRDFTTGIDALGSADKPPIF